MPPFDLEWRGSATPPYSSKASEATATAPHNAAADSRAQIHSPVRQAQGSEPVEGLALAATKQALFP